MVCVKHDRQLSCLSLILVVPVVTSFYTPKVNHASVLTPRQLAQSNQKPAGAPKPWALIFDCDGVLLESESLHREAYNSVFEEFQVNYNWTPEYYDDLQNRVGGGKPKMRHHFNLFGWPSSKLGQAPETAAEQTRLIDELQDRKTAIYKDVIKNGGAQLRPGVMRLIQEAQGMPNIKMAICSASTKESCLYVLDHLLGEPVKSQFDLILAGDDVPAKKPDPLIYTLASERLGVNPDRCVVIEDSLIGLQAAVGAGMRCVITYTPSTKSQDFTGATAVFPELGDSGSQLVTAEGLYGLIEGAGFGKQV